MGRSPCCDDTSGLKKGPWTQEEDELLTSYIQKNGHGSWRALPKSAGLNRCGKSCRLRWTNYLRPDIKRGKFSEEEEDMIIKLHSVLGNKWSRIAAHLPGRTDNEIKNYWNTHLRKKLLQMDEQVLAGTPGFLDEGRSSLRNAFINLDVGRNRMGFEHDGDGPSKQIEASEYWHGKNKHMMNNSRVMSQHESRDSESIDSTSHSVTSKALSKEATSLLRTERTMGRAIDDGHRMKQRKSQLGTRDGRCKSILSARQDGMFLMYTVWAKHKENEITFKFKAESSFGELKQELAERLTLECGKLKIKYLDAPENLARGEPCDPNASIVRDWVLMTCDADLRQCERYSLGMKILLIIQENQDSRALLSEMFVPE